MKKRPPLITTTTEYLKALGATTLKKGDKVIVMPIRQTDEQLKKIPQLLWYNGKRLWIGTTCHVDAITLDGIALAQPEFPGGNKYFPPDCIKKI